MHHMTGRRRSVKTGRAQGWCLRGRTLCTEQALGPLQLPVLMKMLPLLLLLLMLPLLMLPLLMLVLVLVFTLLPLLATTPPPPEPAWIRRKTQSDTELAQRILAASAQAALKAAAQSCAGGTGQACASTCLPGSQRLTREQSACGECMLRAVLCDAVLP